MPYSKSYIPLCNNFSTAAYDLTPAFSGLFQRADQYKNNTPYDTFYVPNSRFGDRI